jgi:MFS transporter, ACS family, tartrate transporter
MVRAVAPVDAAAVFAKARRRLIPFLFVLYIVAYLDRINVGFAALQMNAALGFSSSTYGFGAGIFFLSYVLFEVPSNVILARIGARRWIARIMITWGLVSAGMMFVTGAAGFYTLRFLLGLAEAGFFPGIIFYFTKWFPERDRARTIAMFMTATLTAGVIGAPVSGVLLSLHGYGLAGWQWLFLLEGLPAVVLGVVVLFVLPDGPEDARWLTAAERDAVLLRLREDSQNASRESHTLGEALSNGRVWLIAVAHFLLIPVTLYGVGFWMPQIIKTASGRSDAVVGLLTAIPYAAGAVAMVVAGRHSDRTGDRRWHVAAGAVVSAIGLVSTPAVVGTMASVTTLSIAMIGLASIFGPFWAVATGAARGLGAAAAIALINSVGNTGGFVGPYLLGAISDATHSFAAGLLVIAALMVTGGVLLLTVRHDA